MPIPARLIATAVAVSLGSLQYGFHLAELNAPQDVITCHGDVEPTYDCIPMTPHDIGAVTGAFAIGGLFGATFAGTIANKIGRKRTSLINAAILALGSLIISLSTSVALMSIGRIIAGLGAGSAIVVGPLYLSEIAPPDIRGTLGFVSQISINVGILIAQVAGFFMSHENQWRVILGLGVVLGLVNAVCLIPCAESSQRGSGGPEDEYRPLPHGNADTVGPNKPMSVREFTSNKALRPALVTVVGIMAIQQLSGINAIIFFGVEFLQRAVPQYSKLINVFISIVNLVVTTLVAPQVDKHGRRALLLTSIGGMTTSALILVIFMGVVFNVPTISAICAITFVVSFAIGLGPIPFLIISELVPANAAGAAQSLGTTANWLSAFFVGYLFPVLEAEMGASVFIIFFFTGLAALAFVWAKIPANTNAI